MAQYIIVGVIIVVAVAAMARAVYRTATGKGGCACGTGGCAGEQRPSRARPNDRLGTRRELVQLGDDTTRRPSQEQE